MTVSAELLAGAVAACQAAGAAIMDHYEASGTRLITNKDDNTQTTDISVSNPLTEADLASDRLLKERLLALLPEAGWLSEETEDNPQRLDRQFVWVVDPLDGTREFVLGIPEFTVSVALVGDGSPLLGVICNPVTAELYVGAPGQGATLNGVAGHGIRPVRPARRCRGRQPLGTEARGIRARGRAWLCCAPWVQLPTSWRGLPPDSVTPRGAGAPRTSGIFAPASP